MRVRILVSPNRGNVSFADRGGDTDAPSVAYGDSSPYRENPSGKIGDFDTSPYRGGFGGRNLFVPPERGDAAECGRGVNGEPLRVGIGRPTSPCRENPSGSA